jgi:Lon protease-like protein
MDLIAVGQLPFRVAEVHQEKPYLEATVDFLADETDPATAATAGELSGLFEKCYLLAHGNPPPARDEGASEPGISLAYEMAGDLPLDLDAAQELLEIRSEPERQTRLLEHLRLLLPRLLKIAQIRSRAAGNGHGRN